MGSKHMLAGGVLTFLSEAAAATIDGIKDFAGKRKSRAEARIDDDILRSAAPLFTSAWPLDVLPKAMGKNKPTVQNSAGEEIMFYHIRFPLAAGVVQKEIGACLDDMPGLQRENASFWNWLDDAVSPKPGTTTAPNAISWNMTMADGSLVLGISN